MEDPASLDPRRRAPILLVQDLERACTFWQQKVGFEVRAERPGLCWMTRGRQEVTLWARAAVRERLGDVERNMGDAGCYFVTLLDDEGDPRTLLDPDGHRVVCERAPSPIYS